MAACNNIVARRPHWLHSRSQTSCCGPGPQAQRAWGQAIACVLLGCVLARPPPCCCLACARPRVPRAPPLRAARFAACVRVLVVRRPWRWVRSMAWSDPASVRVYLAARALHTEPYLRAHDPMGSRLGPAPGRVLSRVRRLQQAPLADNAALASAAQVTSAAAISEELQLASAAAATLASAGLNYLSQHLPPSTGAAAAGPPAAPPTAPAPLAPPAQPSAAPAQAGFWPPSNASAPGASTVAVASANGADGGGGGARAATLLVALLPVSCILLVGARCRTRGSMLWRAGWQAWRPGTSGWVLAGARCSSGRMPARQSCHMATYNISSACKDV